MALGDALSAPNESVDVTAPQPDNGPQATPAPSSADQAQVPMDTSQLPATSNPPQNSIDSTGGQAVQPPQAQQKPVGRLRGMAEGALAGLLSGGFAGVPSGAVAGLASPQTADTTLNQIKSNRAAATATKALQPAATQAGINFQNASAAHGIAMAHYFNTMADQMPAELQLKQEEAGDSMIKALIPYAQPTVVDKNDPNSALNAAKNESATKGSVGDKLIIRGTGGIYAFDLNDMGTNPGMLAMVNEYNDANGRPELTMAQLKQGLANPQTKQFYQTTMKLAGTMYQPQNVNANNRTNVISNLDTQIRTATANGHADVAAKLQKTRDQVASDDYKDTVTKPKQKATAQAEGRAPIQLSTQEQLAEFKAMNIPTTTMRNAGAQAQTVIDSLPGVIQDIQQNRDKLGAFAGRWNDIIQGKGGGNDPAFAGLRADLVMASTGVALAHARGRMPENLREEFTNLINNPKQSPDNLISVLNKIQPYMQRMAQMGKVQTSNPAAPAPAPAPAPGAGAGAPAPAAPAGGQNIWSQFAAHRKQ